MPDVEITVTMVVNRCAGGFGLSPAAARELARAKGFELHEPVPGEAFLHVTGLDRPIEDLVRRDDPALVSLVRAWGKRANGPNADLRVVEVPVHLDVESADGVEEVNVWGGGFST